MLGMGPTEIIVILGLALLIFGPKRLPEIAQAIGKGIGELKRASRGLQDAVQKDLIQPINEDVVGPIMSASPFDTLKDSDDKAVKEVDCDLKDAAKEVKGDS